MNMLVDTASVAAAAPLTATMLNQTSGAPSRLQKLCAEFLRLHEEQEAKYQRFFAAERACSAAEPPTPAPLRPTKKNMADIDDFIWKPGTKRYAIRASEIEHDIASIKRNTCQRVDTAEGMMVLTQSAKPPYKVFPLTRKQKARLARLERLLPIARKHEAQVAKLEAQFRIRELEEEAGSVSDRLIPLARRLATIPSKTRADLIAKARVHQTDREICEDLAASICADLMRLATSLN